VRTDDFATREQTGHEGTGPDIAELCADEAAYELTETHLLIAEDFRARGALGRKKYGRALRPNDGRDSLIDLYQELLDARNYARKAEVEAGEMGRYREAIDDLILDLRIELEVTSP
jgi:hypothetical protein